MNEARRKAINLLDKDIEKLADLHAAMKSAIQSYNEAREELKDEVESIRDEEQEYFDNMPEGLQGGEKGEKAQEAIDALERAITLVEDEIEEPEEFNKDELTEELNNATA